jgi:hypothetical protein
MSTVSKIFIVLILLLSVSFCIFTLTYFAHAKSYKQALEDEQAQSRALNDQLHALQTEKETAIQRLTQEKMKLAEETAAKQTEVEKWKNLSLELEREMNTQTVELKQKTQDITNLTDSLRRLTEESDTLQEQISEHQRVAEEARRRAEAAEEELYLVENTMKQWKSQYEDEAKKNYDLAMQLEEHRQAMHRLEAQGIKVHEILLNQMRTVRGMVTGVDPNYHIVILDVGEQDGVQEGYNFKIHRGGAYLGEAKVYMVRPEWCAADANLVNEQKPFEVGDEATTNFSF